MSNLAPIDEVLILAGGLGTRLRLSVPDLPKCMAPINGIPFLHFLITEFEKQGIKKFIFSLGYKHNYFVDFLKAYKHIQYELFVENEPLGTGGAIKYVASKIKREAVIVTNGDTLFKINIKQLIQFHQNKKAECSLALKEMTDFDRYGAVTLNAENKILHFNEKQYCKKGLINGGVMILDIKKFTSQFTENKFSFESHYLQKKVQSNYFYGQVQDAYFIDIGVPADYERAQKEIN